MSPLRVLFALGALAAMTVVADAGLARPGQPFIQPGRFGAAPGALLPNLLPYVGDENFQKELGLTADQAKRLVAFRQKLWDEAYTTAPRDLKVADQHKATEAEFKAVLDAAQLKRATQLAAQLA